MVCAARKHEVASLHASCFNLDQGKRGEWRAAEEKKTTTTKKMKNRLLCVLPMCWWNLLICTSTGPDAEQRRRWLTGD